MLFLFLTEIEDMLLMRVWFYLVDTFWVLVVKLDIKVDILAIYSFLSRLVWAYTALNLYFSESIYFFIWLSF